MDHAAIETDIDHLDHLIDQISEILLPSVGHRWHLRAGDRTQMEAVLQAKGDLIRAIGKLEKMFR